MSKAIVLVAFGSANLQGINDSIGLLEKDLNKCIGKEYTIIKAFTSNKIIDLLKERYDCVIPHLRNALFSLVNHGYEEVILQPLHIMNGRDYKEIEFIAKEYKYSFRRLVISKPLFSGEDKRLLIESCEIAEIICENIKDSNILLVGHGSKRSSNRLYDEIEKAVEKINCGKTYMATLEGNKTINDVIQRLIEDKVTALTLKSLFIIPGKHILTDIMATNNSWVSKLKENGIEVLIDNKSLLEYKKIRQLFIKKINEEINN